jgi:TctA family transporter
MDAKNALAFLLAAYSVACTGGSVTAILLNMPGTGSNAATLLDGFPMTKKGRGGRALGNALTASALGGIVGAVVLAFAVPLVRPIVTSFASPECLLLVLLGISFIAVLSRESTLKGLTAGGIGLMISFVGYQGITAIPRFTFGSTYLFDGIRLVPLALGLFAVPEIINLIRTGGSLASVEGKKQANRADILQGIRDVFHHWWLFIRCSTIGTLVGIVPGVGGDTAVWIAYGHAKQTSKHPERFGTGCEEGVIAPECANNAKEGGALLPTLAFGIPGSASMAVLLGAMLIVGIQPGPAFLKEHLDIAFSLVAVLVFSNVVGAGICLQASTILIRLSYIRGHIIAPIILVLIAIGAYCIANNLLDVISAFLLGGLGYAMSKHDYSRPALLLGYIFGEPAEKYLYISLEAYGWSFILRPIALGILVIITLGFLWEPAATVLRRKFKHAR